MLKKGKNIRKGLSNLYKIIIVVIVMIIAISAVAAYISSIRQGTKTVVTIIFTGWVSSGAEAQFDQEMVNLFNAQHPDIKVVFEPITSDYNTKLKAEIAAGNAPDVFYVDSSEAYTYIKAGLLMPLNTFISKNASYNISDFIPETLQPFEYNGTIYAIPKDWSPLGLYYNPIMFKEANISHPPQNWRELFDDAAKLTIRAPNGTVLRYGLAIPPDMARILAFVYQAGGYWISPNGVSVGTNTTQFREALYFIYQMLKDGYAVMPQAIGAGWDGQAFGEGKVAMTFEGQWMSPYLKQTYPNVTYAVAPMPAGPTGNATLLFTVGLAIPYNDKHPQQAWEFIEFFTSEQGQAQWIELGLALPTRISLQHLPYFNAHPNELTLIKEFPYAHAWSFNTTNFDKAYNDANAILQELFTGQLNFNQTINQLTITEIRDLSSTS